MVVEMNTICSDRINIYSGYSYRAITYFLVGVHVEIVTAYFLTVISQPLISYKIISYYICVYICHSSRVLYKYTCSDTDLYNSPLYIWI